MTELDRIGVELREHSVQIAREGRAREKAVLFLLQQFSQGDVMQSWVVEPPLACADYLLRSILCVYPLMVQMAFRSTINCIFIAPHITTSHDR